MACSQQHAESMATAKFSSPDDRTLHARWDRSAVEVELNHEKKQTMHTITTSRLRCAIGIYIFLLSGKLNRLAYRDQCAMCNVGVICIA